MKVGKAIYNILSQSTDVQSNFPFNTTDYSPTGTELVTNGDFSAAGINLVDNPNFTDTGADVIYNGDFADTSIALGTTGSGWTLSAGLSEYTTFGGDTAVKMTRVTTTNQLRAKTDVGGNVLTPGASYKLTYKVLENNGVTSFRAYHGSSSTLPVTLDITHTVYFTNAAANSVLQFINDTNNSDITLTDIVVKELGADWTLGTGWSIGEDKAICTANGGFDALNQGSVMDSGSSYKVTYTADLSLITSGALKLGTFSNSVTERTVLDGTNTVYLTANGGTFQVNEGGALGTATITNISVQELGEGWTLQSGWSVGDSKASYDAVTNARNIKQLLNFELGKSYKIQFTTSTGTAKLKFTDQLGTQLFTDIAIDEYAPNSYTLYGTAIAAPELRIYAYNTGGGEAFSITNILVEEMVLNKIFPELAPPDIDAPYIVYSVVSNSPSETKNTNGDIDTASIEVYGFQDTYNKAVDLGVSVRAALDRKTGTYNTIEIQSTNYVNEQMDVNEARKLWAAIQDYTIRIKNK